MRFNIDRKEFLGALRIAAKAAASATGMPILRLIRVEVPPESGHVRLLATDLEVQCEACVSVAERPAPGVCYVDPKALGAALRGSKVERLDVVFDGDRLHVGGVTLPVTSAEDAPLPLDACDVGDPQVERIDVGPLADALRVVAPCMSDDETCYTLHALYFEPIEGTGGGLRLVATDDHRLGVADLPGFTWDVATVWPAPAVRLLLPLVTAKRPHAAVVTFRRVGKVLAADMAGPRLRVVVMAKPVDGELPDYRHAVPKRNGSGLVVARGAIQCALDATSAVWGSRDNRSAVVKIEAHDGRALRFIASHPDVGEASAEVPCDPNGWQPIAFNGRYLHDALSGMGERVEIHNAGPLDAAIFHDAAAPWFVVVMPTRT